MGRIFTLPPSRWEVDHAAGILAGIRHEAATGEMPQGPMWSMLERRYDLAPVRFARWHPNTALLIERSRLDQCPPPPPADWCDPPPSCVFVPPCEGGGGGNQTVPEPASVIVLAIGVVLGWLVGRAIAAGGGRRDNH